MKKFLYVIYLEYNAGIINEQFIALFIISKFFYFCIYISVKQYTKKIFLLRFACKVGYNNCSL